jgi:hypothetical protein
MCRLAEARWRVILLVIAFMFFVPRFASADSSEGVLVIARGGSLWAVNLTTPERTHRLFTRDRATTDRHPDFALQLGTLAFDRTAFGRAPMIYIARANAGPRELVEGRDPSFSPTGRRLVASGPTGLFIVEIETGRIRQLTNNTSDAHPDWGTGGILCDRQTDRKRSIVAIRSDGSDLRQIAASSVSIAAAQWAPNGTDLLASGDPQSGRDCARARARTHLPHVRSRFYVHLFASKACNLSAAWSPDGREVTLPAGPSMAVVESGDGSVHAKICADDDGDGDNDAEGVVWLPTKSASELPDGQDEPNCPVPPPPHTTCWTTYCWYDEHDHRHHQRIRC